ncbi:hypothetical protein A2316_01645 [Candidatus Falkowbacteria bacterium RIFOXYB2_FULL_38_15]|uniref:Cohesin domain-containing protein n=1 Tax=Candidatus Falkowbacteria bacterium RIFOXYA2_FULL_38_12 TaxID=1797993 RepID=A0A1F5S1G3_9BACT|nr:MAG: hypothetical protein A2257_04075 [Candidatus Falkowbacteria bacterium RIFOXYA2_FULL_38_12]OGF32938.1 MAG: hypothetical protein A2316_01645 [Candidatus Falkowbacteria bacterium RIFOXYB2_FULL_38_15]OGF44108.1 MAG: hypothetical protein A2555_01815 [Candidatus Falkowbacteria bacterium RIFOXYD2_FULL_39_16]
MARRQKVKILLFFSSAIIFFVCWPAFAKAANLYFSPSSWSYSSNSSFSVGIYVSSSDQVMNAVSGTVSFPKDQLEVSSISKGGSILSLWVQEPSFQNSTGKINFEGIVLNPGFKGASGKLITINFKAKKAGEALLNFSSSSVLANDGNGTNILKSLGTAKFSIGAATPTTPEVKPAPVISDKPSAPHISSPTHPDQDKWYASEDAKFVWTVPQGIKGAQLLISKIPRSTPTTTYTSAITSKEIFDLSDGTWYFHARLKNDAGWGSIFHFRFQIDMEKPVSLRIEEQKREDLTNPKVKFKIQAEDRTSGIDYYEIDIDKENTQIWEGNEDGIFETSVLIFGKHILNVRAVDKAGNAVGDSAEFEITPLDMPNIIDYPKGIKSGEKIIFKGATGSGTRVSLWLQKQGKDVKNYIIDSDKSGNFIFTAKETATAGNYEFWAEAVNSVGAKSKPTDKVSFVVGQQKIGDQDFLTLAVVAIIILLLAIITFVLNKFFSLRKKIRREAREATYALYRTIDLLKEDIQEQAKLLEKRRSKIKFTEEEKNIRKIKRDINNIAEIVGKEIKNIEKEVE